MVVFLKRYALIVVTVCLSVFMVAFLGNIGSLASIKTKFEPQPLTVGEITAVGRAIQIELPPHAVRVRKGRNSGIRPVHMTVQVSNMRAAQFLCDHRARVSHVMSMLFKTDPMTVDTWRGLEGDEAMHRTITALINDSLHVKAVTQTWLGAVRPAMPEKTVTCYTVEKGKV